MFGMSFPEIFVILALALVILGPEKLPDVARTLGKALREMRKAGNTLRDAIMLEEELHEFKKNTREISDALSTSPRDLMLEDDPASQAFDHDDYLAHHGQGDDPYGHTGAMAYDPHWSNHHSDLVTQHHVDLSPQRHPLPHARHVWLAPATPPSLDDAHDDAPMAHAPQVPSSASARQIWLHDQLPHEATF